MNFVNSLINDQGHLEQVVLYLLVALVFVLSALSILFAYRSEKFEKLYNYTNREARLLARQKNLYENELKTFANLMDEITFPIWQRDKDMNIIYCNRRFCEVTGEIRDNITRNNHIELFRDAKEIASRATKTGQFQVVEHNIVIAGSNTLNQVVEIPISDKNAAFGAKNGTIGFALNLIELQNTRERLKLNLELQKKLLESLNSAVAIYGVNQKLEYYNRAFVNLWKFDEDWLRTYPTYGEILEALREKRNLPEQADFASFKRDNINMFTNLISQKEDYYYLLDGRVLKVIIIPYQNRGLLFYYEDMTTQLSLERKYNTLVSVQKHTLDNLNESVVVFGEDGKMELYNPNFASLWGFSESFLSSEPHLSRVLDEMVRFYNIEDAKTLRDDFIASLNGRHFLEKKTTRNDGKVLIERFTPLPDGATLITYFDITDKENVERSLRAEKLAYEEADRIKTNFLGNVSYELRSPLTSIMGFSEMLQAGMGGKLEAKSQNYIDDIHNSSLRLKELIDTIIDVSSFDAGYVDLNKSKVAVKELVEPVVGELINSAKKKNINIKVNISDDLKKISADKIRLQQALQSLIGFSLAMCKAKQVVNVDVFAEAGRTIFEIADNGIGLTEKDVSHIFDQFYKVESGDVQGAGLGLYLAKKITEMHGGVIVVESQIDAGTKFRITL